MQETIKIRGAKEHNLKNINLDIPKNKLIVFTGVSGSGKSSLAFDTIYAEGQRRYVESLSSYARQFLGIMNKPDVDLIEGLSPSISIDQKTTSHNPRSTVGTVTEIYDYIRLLFARVGHPHCPICGQEISGQSLDQIVDRVLVLLTRIVKQESRARFFILSPIVKDKKGEFSSLLDALKAKGIKRVRVDGRIHNLDEELILIKTNKHTIEALIDRLSLDSKDLKDKLFKKNLISRLTDSIQTALNLADGLVIISLIEDAGFKIPEFPKKFVDHLFSERFACPIDNIQLPEIEPRTFSFNSPHGACPKCTGIGKILEVDESLILAPQISILEGAIIPFSSMFEHDTWFARLILKVCQVHHIDPHQPIQTLSPGAKKILLQGTGDREYLVNGKNKQGKLTSIYQRFRGIVGELKRRHSLTDSDYVRMSIERFMKEKTCPLCQGTRLKKESLSITIDQKSISQITSLSVTYLFDWIKSLSSTKILSERERKIAKLILKEIETRLSFLKAVGLEYLTLDRAAGTLAGGEAQRIRLASQIGSGLTGVLYVLDEPTIGLHPRDNARLIDTLKKLRDIGNSVIVVEHDRDMMGQADQIFDFGPRAGKTGGQLICQGTLAQIKKNSQSLTGKYLAGKREIVVTRRSLTKKAKEIKLFQASQFNLKKLTVSFPLAKFICVTGVSGSGKSTLIVETLYHALAQKLNPYHKYTPGAFARIEGVENIDKVSLINQSPIGRTPRSNPATYTKTFDLIRQVYASTREARAQGFKSGRFSFNVKGGRCEACQGQGQTKIEMQFMADIWIDCEICQGKRYNNQTLEINYKGKNIAEVLDLSVSEAKEFFHLYPGIIRKLETLEAVGLDYIELGQSATTLSGGEAQRVKLATELGKKHSGQTVYILDEPTTGLHFYDLEKLINVLRILVDKGNTVIVIEHNMDVIRSSDWIIDLGPEGGEAGGYIVAQGTPEQIARNQKSYTGKFLRQSL